MDLLIHTMKPIVHWNDLSINSQTYRHCHGRQSIEEAIGQRHSGALFLVDIGVPRNIDQAAGKLDNVFLYDIDTLQTMVDENVTKRKEQIPKVESIVGEEVSNFFTWASSLEVAPTIKDLTKMAEEIRRLEVEKNVNRFDEKDRRTYWKSCAAIGVLKTNCIGCWISPFVKTRAASEKTMDLKTSQCYAISP